MRKDLGWFGVLVVAAGLAMGLPSCSKEEGEKEDKPEVVTPAEETDKISIDWVDIPAGKFVMGSAPGTSKGTDENPDHDVELTAFRMSATEITNKQYKEFLTAIEKEKPDVYKKVAKSGSFHPDCQKEWAGDNQPVVCVTFQDAQAFCDWAGCQLPTEAQWEYACRAESTDKFAFGSTLDKTQAHFGATEFVSKDVKSYEPNKWGLYDMHGNVYEWVTDWYSATYYEECKKLGTVKDPTGPKNPDSDRNRVARSGGWIDSEAGALRSAKRSQFPEGEGGGVLGFRVVRAAK